MGNLLHKIKKTFSYPGLIAYRLLPSKLLTDKFYINTQYFSKTNLKLNLNNPMLFNEKLQWLKLYNRQDIFTKMVDKYEVRNIVKEKIGDKYLVPLLGTWDKFDDISFDLLPNQFILKCNHDSGSYYICKNKSEIDINKIKKYFNLRLSKNHYNLFREWAYKNVQPKIIAEELIIDETDDDLKDYKIFCFNGEPKIIEVDFDQHTNQKRNFYTTNWDYIPFSLRFPTDPNKIIEKPKKLELMIDLAKTLSASINHVRVDFHSIGEKIYFGEMTFYHDAGYAEFKPFEWNKTFGDLLVLPNKKQC